MTFTFCLYLCESHIERTFVIANVSSERNEAILEEDKISQGNAYVAAITMSGSV